MSNLPQNGKRRSRWGTQGAARPRSARHDIVTDQDAIQALLAEAHEKQQQREQQQQRHHGQSQQNHSRFERKRPRGHDEPSKDGNQPDDYYGPQKRHSHHATVQEEEEDDVHGQGETVVIEKQKPNFGLSGALSKDKKGGNMYKGVLLKFQEPPDARAPDKTQWRLYVFKGEEQIDTLHIAKQSAYLIGRNEDIADIPLQHPSCSSQHAVLQYRAVPHKETGKLHCQPYLMDLESTNGTFINGERLDSARYYQLKKGDVIKFGASTREFVLLAGNTTSLR